MFFLKKKIIQYPILVLIFAITPIMGDFVSAQELESPKIFNEKNSSLMQLESENYRIIFQAYQKGIALNLLLIMQEINPILFRNIFSKKSQQRKIPILIDGEAFAFNGSANPFSLYRSILYPNDDHYLLNTINPYYLLALHEGRHMSQFQLINTANNWAKFVNVLFGEKFGFILSSLYLPNWYFEGEAVVWETIFSLGGRGRIPYFDLHLRARILYEDNPVTDIDGLPYGNNLPQPSPYVLGYYFITYLMINYGEDTISKVIRGRGEILGLYPTLNGALENQTGKSFKEHYAELNKNLMQIWKQQQLDHQPFTKGEIVLANATDVADAAQAAQIWTSYDSPQFDEEGNLYYIKSKLSTINKNTPSRLYRISSNQLENINNNAKIKLEEKETLIISPFKNITSRNEIGYSVGGGKVVWTERFYPLKGRTTVQQFAPDHSKVMIYDLKTKKTYQIGDQHTRYEKALISRFKNKKGYQILLLQNKDTLNKNSIEVWEINIEENQLQKKQLKVIPIKETIFGWDLHPNHQDLVLALGNSSFSEGNRLVVINLKNSLKNKNYPSTILIGPTLEERFSNPVWYGDSIIHHSDYSGIDNLYVINRKSKKRFRVTSRPLASMKPVISPHQKYLYFTDYQLRGWSLMRIPLPSSSPNSSPLTSSPLTSKWQPLNQVKVNRTEYFEPLLTEMKKNIKKSNPFGKLINNRLVDTESIIDEEQLHKFNYSPYSLSSKEWLPNSWILIPSLGEVSFLNFNIYFNNIINSYALELAYLLEKKSLSTYYRTTETKNILVSSFLLNYQYRGFYPFFHFQFKYTFLKDYYDSIPNQSYLHYFNLRPTISIPFNLNSELKNLTFNLFYSPIIRLQAIKGFDALKYIAHQFGGQINFGESHWQNSFTLGQIIYHQKKLETFSALLYFLEKVSFPGFFNYDRFNLSIFGQWLYKRKFGNFFLPYYPKPYSHSWTNTDLSVFLRFSYSPFFWELKFPMITTYSLTQTIELSLISEYFIKIALPNQLHSLQKSDYYYPGMGLYYNFSYYGSYQQKMGGELFYDPSKPYKVSFHFVLSFNLNF